MTKGEWNVKLLEAYKATIEVLDEIKTRTTSKFGFKPLISIELYDYWKDPTWYHQTVKIGYNHEPEALAHELGHGHEEIIREQPKKSQKWGEHFAEAIRFYVEEKMRTDSEWFKDMEMKIRKMKNGTLTPVHKDRLDVLKACNDLDTYITKLSNGELFKKLGI